MLQRMEGRTPGRHARQSAADTGEDQKAMLTGLWRPRRVLLYAAALCLITLIPYTIALVSDVARGAFPAGSSGAPVGGDLPSHLLGGRLFLHGDLHRLYDLDYQRQFWLAWFPAADFNPYVSPPFMTVVYAPLAALPYGLALAIWTVISVSSLVLSFHLLWPLLPNLHRFGRRTLLAHLFVAPPVLYVLFGGQDSAVSLLLLAGGLRLLLGGQSLVAGALLGLGVYKPQLFVIVPVLLLAQRRWRALAGWIITAGGLTLISMAMVGSQGIRDYAALPGSAFYRHAVVEGKGWEMQSFVALARAVLPPSLQAAVAPLTIVVGLIAGALLARSAMRHRQDERAVPAVFGLALLAVPFVSPHLFLYDTLILAIPVLLLANADLRDWVLRWVLALAYLCLWTTPYRHFAVEGLPWPATLVEAPWGQIAFVALFALSHHRLMRASTSAC
ncbi:MAG: hypothetical protein C4346_09125 [Chloroflexota bacterium]